ncbi:hypothetical protein [Candidatus Sororendozoicomonas aggregata]|uniref:hypothetical protein n=1 Tax=Candidatus Sororendozoicomonas aggregata TaxID=3073239 RepID=UPI002ED33DE6
MLAAPSLTPGDQQALADDLAAWGVTDDPQPQPDTVEVWEEHREALLWWFSGGAQLKWLATAGGMVCQGLDVVALRADATLSGRDVTPEDYQRMRLIATVVAETLNQQAEKRYG